VKNVNLHLPEGEWARIRQHLRPKRGNAEEAVFVFAAIEETPLSVDLRLIESYPVPSEGFDHQSEFYLQLTDEEKAKLIKRAHDLGASLIEIHSHPMQLQAEFSPSDLLGFKEFVPHVRWRLKRRPYAAIVVAQRSFDAMAWIEDGTDPGPLAAIFADGHRLVPTGNTLAARAR
jgi:hypothetical protein